MSELNTLIIQKLENVESDISDIKITMAENTADMKYHIKRTDGLQEMVTDLNQIVQPIYQEHIAKKAIDEYKKKAREDLIYKLKLPGYIVAALAALGTALAWIMSK